MPASSPLRGFGRSRLLLASALTATVTASTVLAAPSTPTAEARLPVARAHHKAHVHQVKVDPRLFGVHDSFQNSLNRAGTGAIRLWDSGTQWKDVIPDEDAPPNWTRLDSFVQKAHQDGTEVTLVLGLTPQYAAANPSDPGYRTSMPDLTKYTDYVRAVMTHYSKANWGYRGIAAYQVWNEANIVTFWTGTNAQLGQLVKAVYTVRNQVDPGVKVIAPAMVTRLQYQLDGIKKFYRTRVGGKPVWRYVDAISLSLYPLDVYTHPNHPGTPEDSMALLKTVRGILAKDKVPSSLPIWNTEINYGLRYGGNGGKAAAPISSRRQVAYLMRTYLLNAAQGVKRVDWYAYDMDSRGALGPLGNTLLTDPADRPAGDLLPAGRAFTRVQQWMHGTMVGTASKRPCIVDRHGTYTCLIKYAKGVGRVYWNPYRSAKVRLVNSATRKVSELGRTSKAHGGARLKVNYQPILVKSSR
jgi:hypothetical protein